MSEMPFGGENKTPSVEAVPVKTKQLGEGVSTGWENERKFTAEEVMALVKGLDAKAGDLRATEQIVSHEGVLIALYLRAPGSASGYSFMLKGNHGPRNASKHTMIDRIDYDGPDSEDVVYGEVLAEYIDGAWVKQ